MVTLQIDGSGCPMQAGVIKEPRERDADFESVRGVGARMRRIPRVSPDGVLFAGAPAAVPCRDLLYVARRPWRRRAFFPPGRRVGSAADERRSADRPIAFHVALPDLRGG